MKETPAEKYARKQRERVAAEAARSKKDRKRERARGFQRPPVDEETAAAAQARVHARTFPEDEEEFAAFEEKHRLAAIVTDVAVERSQEEAFKSMTGQGRVAFSRSEPTPKLEELLEEARERARKEGGL